MLKIPPDVKVIELTTSTIWFDENGILNSISKAAQPKTLEEAKAIMSELLFHLGTKKVCMLLDITHSTESTREMREYAAEELPKIAKAIALVSRSPLGKMLANLFFRLKTQPYPVKMFNDEADAREWLKRYL